MGGSPHISESRTLTWMLIGERFVSVLWMDLGG